MPFRSEGPPFFSRLLAWLNNVASDAEKKILFSVLRHMTFVDISQIASLYRDVFRSVISPWVWNGTCTTSDLLSPDYARKTVRLVCRYRLFYVTNSFDYNTFERVNSLSCLRRGRQLTEVATVAREMVTRFTRKTDLGAIVLEDFVGCGQQCRDVLKTVRATITSKQRVLFSPLIAMEDGYVRLRNALPGIDIRPVIIIPKTATVRARPVLPEHKDFAPLRALILSSWDRVRRKAHKSSPAASDPFGHGGAGAILVTAHNAPNNSIHILHRIAPQWNPLFRRLEHQEA